MINTNTSLGHDLVKVTIRHRVADIEEDREQDPLLRKLVAFE